MIGLCDNCALKYADCKGNKDKEKCRCDYYKKPVVMNVKELAERVAELEVMANRYKWVPVTDRLPDERAWLFVCTEYEGIDGDYWNGVGWTRYDDVLAWMPMPEPYKEV